MEQGRYFAILDYLFIYLIVYLIFIKTWFKNSSA